MSKIVINGIFISSRNCKNECRILSANILQRMEEKGFDWKILVDDRNWNLQILELTKSGNAGQHYNLWIFPLFSSFSYNSLCFYIIYGYLIFLPILLILTLSCIFYFTISLFVISCIVFDSILLKSLLSSNLMEAQRYFIAFYDLFNKLL